MDIKIIDGWKLSLKPIILDKSKPSKECSYCKRFFNYKNLSNKRCGCCSRVSTCIECGKIFEFESGSILTIRSYCSTECSIKRQGRERFKSPKLFSSIAKRAYNEV